MSVEDAPLRSVLWSHDSRVVIFPPFESYPEISSKGFTDLRAYVAAGNNLVFMGSYIALQVWSCCAELNFVVVSSCYGFLCHVG